MRKVYARQIRPEYQESPLEWEGYPTDLIMPGNRDYRSHNTDHTAYRQIMFYFDDMAESWKDDTLYDFDGLEKRTKPHSLTIAKILHYYGFEREDGKPWTNQQKHEWRMLMESNYSAEDEQVFLMALQLITGMEWETRYISGCCQGERAEIIYPVQAYSREDIDRFETAYFNLGTEWVIHDGNDAPESANDVSGACTYCYASDEDGIKKEIASLEGVQPEDVVLYYWTGEAISYKYRMA